MTVRIYVGDCRDVLKTLPDESVQCAITSPPYWGLRDYSTEPQVWASVGKSAFLAVDCEHVWNDENRKHPMDRDGNYGNPKQYTNVGTVDTEGGIDSAFCQLCGAWRGSLGLEPTPELYVQHLVEIFREVKRVLRDDGTLWLNLGSSYAGSWGNYHPNSPPGKHGQRLKETARWNRPAYNDQAFLPPTANARGFKPKDLIMIPWLVALALQNDGWWLRRDIIWAKGVSFLESYAGSSMPESCQDRPSSSHEYVFLLTKSARYFYDIEAVKEQAQEPHAPGNLARQGILNPHGGVPTTPETDPNRVWGNGKRNLRSVWVINPQGFKEAHFATMAPALVEPMILAGTSERGCCPECGAAWKRVIEKHETGQTQKMTDGWDTGPGAHGTIHRDGRSKGESGIPVTVNITVDWQPTCRCNIAYPGEFLALDDPAFAPHDPVPCTILDPFSGAGTTGVVADRLGRDAILIELNPEYAQMSKERIEGDAPMFVDVRLIDA